MLVCLLGVAITYRSIAYHSYCERVPSALCHSTGQVRHRLLRPRRGYFDRREWRRLLPRGQGCGQVPVCLSACVRALDCASEHHRCEYLADTMLITSIGTRWWQFDQAHRWRIHHGHSWTHAGHDQGALPNRSLREQPTGASQCMVPITNASADSLLD